MVVLGAYVKVRSGRYLVGFAWIDDLALQATDSFAAPADRDEAGQLGELHVRTEGVIAEASPDLFVLKRSEIQTKKQATIANHAEGVILAAAGRTDSLEPLSRSRQKLAAVGGSNRNTQLVDNLCNLLDRRPDDDECAEAAAGAVGGLREKS